MSGVFCFHVCLEILFCPFQIGSILRVIYIPKNGNSGMENTQKAMELRSTLTISSTFPQSHSKMRLAYKPIRKQS